MSSETVSDEPYFVVQRCRSCGTVQHYERPRCLRCRSADLAAEPASGRGVIHSFTLVQRSPLAHLDPPFVLALVRLDEGPVVMSHIVGTDASQLRCEQPVAATWRTFDGGDRLAVFQRDDTQERHAADTR